MPQQPFPGLKNLNPPVPDQSLLTTREKLIVLHGSKLHGNKFIPLEKEPAASEFEGPLYEDDTEYRFSEEQLASFSHWERSAETNDVGAKSATVHPLDLVQDVSTDCSVVASLCAETARAERLGTLYQSMTKSIIYPSIGKSQNGKYVCKLNFNGCFRRVVIDDRLPASKTERALHVVDRGPGGARWPALVEKAYLKVAGGYDFPGSNSGTDLWMLTGWIPEQLFLDSDEITPNSIWRRIFNAFNYGDVLITLGTGNLTQEEESHFGLVRRHAYAITNMKQNESVRLFQIKNPWSSGGGWTGDTAYDASAGDEDTKSARETKPGTFWMELSNVFRHFQTIYLNWNPGLFSHRQDVHFTWELSKRGPKTSFSENQQYLLQSDKGGTVWLLLAKHYQSFTREDIDNEEIDPRRQKGFLSLYAFKQHHRVQLRRGSLLRASYVDAPNVLLRFEMDAKQSYIIVPSEQDMPKTLLTFSLSAFTNGHLAALRVANEQYPHLLTRQGQWTRDSAGGHAGSPEHHTNPQYRLILPRKGGILVVLEAENEALNVSVKLIHAEGKRIPQPLRKSDVYLDSGDSTPGCAIIDSTEVSAGTYTLVCNTFEAGQLGAFTLKVRTACADCVLAPISASAPGRFTIRAPRAVLPMSVDRILIPVFVRRLTRLHAQVKNVAAGSMRSPLKLTLEFGQGPNKFTLASTGEFAEAANRSLATGDVDVKPAMCAEGSPGVWLVVERMGGVSSWAEAVCVEVLTDDQGISFGDWGREADEPVERFAQRLKIS